MLHFTIDIQPLNRFTVSFLRVQVQNPLFGDFLQNCALEKLPSTTVSLLLTGEPVFTAAFSYLLLGETLSLLGWIGAGLIVTSVVMATTIEGCQAAKAPHLQPIAAEQLSVSVITTNSESTAA